MAMSYVLGFNYHADKSLKNISRQSNINCDYNYCTTLCLKPTTNPVQPCEITNTVTFSSSGSTLTFIR